MNIKSFDFSTHAIGNVIALMFFCGLCGNLTAGSDVKTTQTTGTPGSPSATTTIDRKQLPTPEWIEKITDMHLFDEGWHKLRETIFANQKRLGVLPEDAKLTPWPDELFWKEAESNQVLPMDSTTFTRSLLPRPNLAAGWNAGERFRQFAGMETKWVRMNTFR